MKIEFTEAAKQEANGSGSLQLASKQLDEITKKFPYPTTAEWDRAHDSRGRAVYRLRLSDWMGSSVNGDFTPRELRPGRELRSRLRGLWSNLLKMTSDKQWQKIMTWDDEPGE